MQKAAIFIWLFRFSLGDRRRSIPAECPEMYRPDRSVVVQILASHSTHAYDDGRAKVFDARQRRSKEA